MEKHSLIAKERRLLLKKKKLASKIRGTSLPRQRSAKLAARNGEPLPTHIKLGVSLQKKRVELGLTQKVMAELCHLQVATILKIEKGDLGVRLGTLQTYLDALNLTLELADKDLL